MSAGDVMAKRKAGGGQEKPEDFGELQARMTRAIISELRSAFQKSSSLKMNS